MCMCMCLNTNVNLCFYIFERDRLTDMVTDVREIRGMGLQATRLESSPRAVNDQSKYVITIT